MNRTVKVGIFAGVALGVAGVLIVETFNLIDRKVDVGWGRGRLKASEAAYYTARIERIGSNWRRTAEKAGCSRDGRIKQPYLTCMVIDTLKPAMWLETAGDIDPNNYTELPDNMTWKLCRAGLEGNKDLGPVIRLKIRGMWTKQILPETIYVHSYGRDTDHLSVCIADAQVNTDYGAGAFPVPKFTQQSEQGVDYYDSILVEDREYADSIDAAKGLTGEIAEFKRSVNSEIPVNFQNWLAVEKRLYLEIEKHVQEMGFRIRTMHVTAGPDYTAGHAQLQEHQDSAWKQLLVRSYPVPIFLKIDYLGENMWYLRSASNPGRLPMPSIRAGSLPHLEFLVGGSDNLSKAQIEQCLWKGRDTESMATVPEPACSTTLPNGVRIEFFGICSNPSAGRKWWGPDGTLFEHPLYYNAEAYAPLRKDRRIYEMAWRISGARQTRALMEGSQGCYYHLMRDRYGNDLRNIDPEGYDFDKDRTKTTLKIGVATEKEDMQWVEFRNISLVPGQNFGFEIATGEPEPHP